MEAAKRYALLIALALLGVIALVLLLLWLYSSHQYSQSQKNLATAKATTQVLQSDAIQHSAAIKLLSVENTNLVRDQQLLAAQLKASTQQKLALQQSLNELQQQLTTTLAEANDEHTQAWRADTVPNDVVQLLNQAAHRALCAGTTDPLCADARGSAAVVPHHPVAASGSGMLAPTAYASPLHAQPTTTCTGDIALRRSWQM